MEGTEHMERVDGMEDTERTGEALGRDPEPAGLKYWVGAIKAGRKTAVQVAEMFFFAPEFKTIVKSFGL